MEIDRNYLVSKFKRFTQPGKSARWIHNEEIAETQTENGYMLQLIIPDDGENPNFEALDYLLTILNNFEKVETSCISAIRWFLKLEGDFCLQSIEVIDENAARHDARAVLFFTWDTDFYLYIEVGLIEHRAHYVLAKYH